MIKPETGVQTLSFGYFPRKLLLAATVLHLEAKLIVTKLQRGVGDNG